MSDTPLMRATGLWMKTSTKSGKPYFTGRLGGLRVLILENNRRESDDQPSHFLMFGEAQQQQQQRQETALGARHRMAREAGQMQSDINTRRGRQQQPQQQPHADADLDDEIPF